MKTLRILKNHSAFHALSEKLALQVAFFRESQRQFDAAEAEENAHGYNTQVRARYLKANALYESGTKLFPNMNVYRDGTVIHVEMEVPDEQFAAWEVEVKHLAIVRRQQNRLANREAMYSIRARAKLTEQ